MSREDFRFHFTLRVRWSECDAQGIAFNGSYMEYIEVAQAEYFRNLGMKIYDQSRRAYFDTAMVKATLEFNAPVRVDELLDIHTRVRTIGRTSIVMETEIYRQGSDDMCTRAELVHVDFDSAKGKARVVPDDVRSLVCHFEETGEVLPIERFPNLS